MTIASASRRRSFNRDLGGQARGEGQNGARDSRGFDGFGSFKTSKASKLKSSKADWPPEAIHESCDVQQDLERKRQA